MAAVRKSAVSAPGTWFRRDSNLSVRKRRSVPRASVLTAEPPPVFSPRQQPSSRNLSFSGAVGAQELGKQPEVEKSPTVVSTSRAVPLWLLRLYTAQRYTSIAAFLLVAATLMVYGWTVYSQEMWSQGYRRLQNLLRYERQLTTTNATLTNKMAEEAEKPTTGLVSPTPANTIFLPSTPDNSRSTPKSTTPNPQVQQQILSPLGY